MRSVIAAAAVLLPLTVLAQSTPLTCPLITTVLKEGSSDARTGGAVTYLQTFLSHIESSSSQPITGYFGSITKKNVTSFQNNHALPGSGIVDASTSAMIEAACAQPSTPSNALASSTVATSTEATSTPPASSPPAPPTPSAALDHDPFTSLSASPKLFGTTSDLQGPLSLSILGSNGALEYQNDNVPYGNGLWSARIFPAIPQGLHTVRLSSGGTTLSTSTLKIGLRSFPLLVSTPLSAYDVADGRLTRFGIQAANTGPVELAQLTFSIATTAADVSGVSLYGYTDAAYTQPILNSTTTPLNATAIDPSAGVFSLLPDAPVVIPAGQTYYFELDGSVTPEDSASALITTTIFGDSSPSVFEQLSAIASTSNVVWSPETFGSSTATDFDWLNGAYVLGLSVEGLSMTRTSPPNMSPPSCTLVSTPASTTPGQSFTLSWTSTGARSAQWSTGASDAVSGSKAFASGISATQSFSINFFGQYGTTNCAVVVPVGKSATSSSQTTQSDSFTASPISGKPTLTVTFKASLDNASSCNQLTYTLVYGDGGSSTLTVPKSTCKPQTQTLTHGYTKTGIFAAKLYSGAYSPSNPGASVLLQTQTITVSNTGAAYDPFAQTASASLAVARAQLAIILQELAQLLSK